MDWSCLGPALLWMCFPLVVTQTDLELNDIVIIVRSQPQSYHAQRAKVFKQHILKQQEAVEKSRRLSVYLMHQTWPDIGSWTYLPLIKPLAEKFASKRWLLFCEEETRVDVNGLLDLLDEFDHKKPMFLGRALQDSQPVITHHFAFVNDPSSFSYPDFAAGFALSLTLIKSLSENWQTYSPSVDFSIDPQHELAMFLWNDGKGVTLTDVPELCAGNEDENCVTSYPLHFPQCGDSVSKDDLFVAVKTCEKFHKDRVPVVKRTWAKEAETIEFYSEKEDPSIPTVNLGVPNTERGHCGKTFAILERFLNDSVLSKKDWLLIADDDTIISITRLRQLLACYNPEEAIALGERYGYGLIHGHGYDYITGGGGMVFSRVAVHQLVDSGMCSCADIDSPDDMTLGMCLHRLAIPATHSPLFHQARPEDYASRLLSHQRPVSFHKHWNVDPIAVYDTWFAADAIKSSSGESADKKPRDHQEL